MYLCVSRAPSPAWPARAKRCQFTPDWFAATMGTGILAVALALLPGGNVTLKAIGHGLWLTNIALFVLFSLLYAAR